MCKIVNYIVKLRFVNLYFFDLKEAILHLTTTDNIFKTIIDTHGLPQIPWRAEGFETLTLLILEQQVSVDSAKATFDKLKLMLPQCNPEIILNTDDADFRACGVSRQKTKYIKCLAEAVLEKTLDLDSLSQKTDADIRAELIKIKGIGNWTIDVYLMFSLASPDILPLGDIAIINTIKELLDIHDRADMEIYTQKWAPHRSMATFLLWHHYLKKRKRKIVY